MPTLFISFSAVAAVNYYIFFELNNGYFVVECFGFVSEEVLFKGGFMNDGANSSSE